MRWTATIIDGHEDAVHIVHEGAVLHRLTRIEARALAAELARVADEGETVTERSCFTCAHRNNAVHSCVPFLTDRALGPVTIYVVESGAFDTHDGMPTNRSIPCPGHAPKVTT